MNADSLLHWLMRTSLEASLLILAVLGLRWALGSRLSPAWRVGLWLLVGAKLLLPAFVPAGFGLGAWLQQPTASRAAAAQQGGTVRPAREPQRAVLALRLGTSAAGQPSTEWRFSPKAALVAAWLLGAVGTLLVAVRRQQRFETLLRGQRPAQDARLRQQVAQLAQQLGLKKAVTVLLMPVGTAPAVTGVRHPRLLLPQDWALRFDAKSLRHVLAHELCHVRQGDLAWNWVALLVQAVHWFNPLVWLVVARFQADRELRCDAAALALLAPTERLDYGHTLLRIQESFFAPPAVAGLAPCVRNHPALRQRILMIANPTTRQPVLQVLLTATLGMLVGYSFTTASAQEQSVPPKVRTRESSRNGSPTAAAPTTTEGTPKTTEAPRSREGAGERKTGMRDGEGTRSGTRDDEKPRTGMRDGEGTRSGARDGKKPRIGMRDGEGTRSGARDGEGARKTRTPEGDKTSASGETIQLKVIKGGEAVMVGEEEIAMNRLRGHLHSFLPEHAGAKVVISGEADVPMSALHNTMDAVRDNGNKNVSLQAE